MEIIVLGVGDAFTARHFNASFLIRHDGFALAIDCPDRYRGVLAAAGAKTGLDLRLEDVDAFLITHLHGDHMNGVEAAAFYLRFRAGRTTTLWGQRSVIEEIWPRRLQAAMEPMFDGVQYGKNKLDRFFDFRELKIGEANSIGPFSVEAYLTRHHLPASALKISAGNRMFGYSCDTVFDPRLIKFLEPADLIFHETNLGPGHTPYETLSALPEPLRLKMRLIHYPDDFREEPDVIACAREGEVFRL